MHCVGERPVEREVGVVHSLGCRSSLSSRRVALLDPCVERFDVIRVECLDWEVSDTRRDVSPEVHLVLTTSS